MRVLITRYPASEDRLIVRPLLCRRCALRLQPAEPQPYSAAAVHGSALVVGSSYRWCAAGSGGWALAPITGTAGAGLGCPGVRLFRVEDDDASMSSAAVWVRRVLLRVRMVGAY